MPRRKKGSQVEKYEKRLRFRSASDLKSEKNPGKRSTMYQRRAVG